MERVDFAKRVEMKREKEQQIEDEHAKHKEQITINLVCVFLSLLVLKVATKLLMQQLAKLDKQSTKYTHEFAG